MCRVWGYLWFAGSEGWEKTGKRLCYWGLYRDYDKDPCLHSLLSRGSGSVGLGCRGRGGRGSGCRVHASGVEVKRRE